MITIGINAIGTRHSGAATVLQGFVDGLLLHAQCKKIFVFLSPESERRFSLPQSALVASTDVSPLTANPLPRIVWMQRNLGRMATECGCDIVVNFNNLAVCIDLPQLLFIQQSKYFSAEATSVYWHKGISIYQRLRPVEAFLMRRMMRYGANACQLVVVQTEFMKNWIVESLEICPTRIAVIKPSLPFLDNCVSNSGVSDKLRTMDDSAYEHFLYVGNCAPYKNLNVIVETASLAASNGDPWRFHSTCADPSFVGLPNISICGYLERHELAYAYRRASALVMPSLVETVGFPLLEAMALGVPVIAADRSYAREICGDAALYFDPLSSQSLYDVVRRFTIDSSLRAELAVRSQMRALRFPSVKEVGVRWANAINQVLNV